MQLSPSLSALAQCSRPQQAPRRFRPAHRCFRTIENVRLVCDEFGRCYRSGGGRVIIREGYGEGYNYAPRERYIERRGYYDGGYYNGGPSVGIGVGPGGVGIGFGAGPGW
jgi:hypothetical protein